MEEEILKPSVRELERHGPSYPGWIVCPLCHGRRGEVVPVYDDETGERLDYQVVECSLCHGERVIQRVTPE